MDHHGSDQGSSEWRISYVNFDYRICPTYPRAVVVPAAMGDEVLRCSAQFRSVPNIALLIFMGQISPIYDECRTQSAKVLAMPRRWTHKDDSKTSIQTVKLGPRLR